MSQQKRLFSSRLIRLSLVSVLLVFSMTGLRESDAQTKKFKVATADELDKAIADVAKIRSGGDRSPIQVELEPGTYALSKTIELTDVDVGDGFILKGNEKVTLTGAVPLRMVGSESESEMVQTLAFELPESWTKSTAPRLLLVDGVLRMPARFPNLGTLRVDTPFPDRRSGFTTYAKDIPENWKPDPQNTDLVFLHDWSSSRIPIADFNASERKLTTKGPIGSPSPHFAIDNFESHPRYWLEGSPAFADQIGEWWCDMSKRRILILASKNPMVAIPTVALPELETLIRVRSTGDKAVSNLVLDGLIFTGTTFSLPSGGFAEVQASMIDARYAEGEPRSTSGGMLPAAVHLEQCQAAVVRNCKVSSVGTSGLWIGSRCRECQIIDCVIDRVGGNGINLGETTSRRVDNEAWFVGSPDQVATQNKVLNSTIERCGEVVKGSVGIWAGLNRELTIEGNTIRNLPYTGISMGWIWDDRPSPAGKNIIRKNKIEHVMQLLSDGGGIYTLGRQEETLIEENEIVGVPNAAGRAESNGMFIDEGSTGLLIRANSIRWVSQSPLRFHRAGKNRVDSNRWELFNDATPPLRFNNTPEANIEAVGNTNLTRPSRTYLIGNSLTWDTLPTRLDGEVKFHVDCGKSLPFIYSNPEKPCVEASTIWPIGLRLGPWDYLVVQPFYGSTLADDLRVIESWLADQPRATLVLHSGWAEEVNHRKELMETSSEKMTHSDVYFDKIEAELKSRHPDLTILRTDAYKLLETIDKAIIDGKSPFKELKELYRDPIHMTHELGQPMMHNLMRKTLGQPLKFELIGEKVPQEQRDFVQSILK